MYFEESTLREQIAELEDLYADCLVRHAHQQDLDGIWLLIKELKLQLTQAQNFVPYPAPASSAGLARH